MTNPSIGNSSRSRRPIIAGFAAVLVLVIGIIAWRASAGRAPSPDAPVDQVRQFVASDDFKKLPTEEKKKYADAVEKGFGIDPQQEKMFRNLAQTRMQERLDEYFALPEGTARRDFLDKQIDQQEEMRKMIEGDGKQKDGGPVIIKRGGQTAGAQKELAETVPAEYQTKLAQYTKDLKDRRAARGLPTDGPGGGIMIRVTR